MLTVYKNGQEHTGYDNVPVRRRKLSLASMAVAGTAIMGVLR